MPVCIPPHCGNLNRGVMTDTYDIRPAGREDIDELLRIESLAQPHPWTRQHFLDELSRPYSRIDICRCVGEVAGYLCSWFIAGELHIQNVVTSPEFRRRGVAKELLRTALERHIPEGLELALLEVRAGNAGAIALYRRFGFREAGIRKKYYHDGEDALLMDWRPSSGIAYLNEERRQE